MYKISCDFEKKMAKKWQKVCYTEICLYKQVWNVELHRNKSCTITVDSPIMQYTNRMYTNQGCFIYF